MLGKLIGVGRTAEVYEWSLDQAIKLFYEQIPYGDVSEEFTKHQYIERNSALCTKSYSIERVNDRYGIVYDRLRGTSMTQSMIVGSMSAFNLGLKLGITHSEIHRVRLPELRDLKESLENSIDFSKELELYDKKQLLEILSGLPNDEVLCHMDFHPDNIYLDGNHVTVLDWMTATKGDPLADVARTLMIIQFAEIPNVSEVEKKQIEAIRLQLKEGYKKSYFGEIMSDDNRLNRWMTLMMATRLSENISEVEKETIRKALKANLEEHTSS